MENKHIQNNRNENNKKNDTTKKIGKIHIQENEYIKNRNNFYNQEDIQGNVHYDSTHKEGMRNCQNINILVNQKSHQ